MLSLVLSLLSCASCQISGSQAASWLGFDSDESDGEHSSEDENDEMFSLKPQFEGKAGERVSVGYIQAVKQE